MPEVLFAMKVSIFHILDPTRQWNHVHRRSMLMSWCFCHFWVPYHTCSGWFSSVDLTVLFHSLDDCSAHKAPWGIQFSEFYIHVYPTFNYMYMYFVTNKMSIVQAEPYVKLFSCYVRMLVSRDASFFLRVLRSLSELEAIEAIKQQFTAASVGVDRRQSKYCLFSWHHLIRDFSARIHGMIGSVKSLFL